MLLDHVVVSTAFVDVVVGGDKPVIFWNYPPDPLELPDTTPALADPARVIRSVLSESMPRSRDLNVQRIGGDGSETWVEFEVSGSIELGEDLHILQGTGPVLIPEGEIEGLIQMSTISDTTEEDAEILQLALKHGDDYQLGYPSEAILVVEDVPPPLPIHTEPVGLSIQSN